MLEHKPGKLFRRVGFPGLKSVHGNRGGIAIFEADGVQGFPGLGLACSYNLRVLPDGRTAGPPPRSSEQRLGGLAKANEVRRARARLKRDLAAGRVELARVLIDPPPCAQTAKLRDLLLAVPRIGPARVNRALAHCRIADGKTIAGLSDRQRAALIQLLHH